MPSGSSAALLTYPALRALPIQLLVGENDNEDITVAQDDPGWAPGANHAGATRRERLAALYEQYQRQGCDATLEIIEDCGHEWPPLRDATIRFFEASTSAAS